jgi:hypothetical protein
MGEERRGREKHELSVGAEHDMGINQTVIYGD